MTLDKDNGLLVKYVAVKSHDMQGPLARAVNSCVDPRISKWSKKGFLKLLYE